MRRQESGHIVSAVKKQRELKTVAQRVVCFGFNPVPSPWRFLPKFRVGLHPSLNFLEIPS